MSNQPPPLTMTGLAWVHARRRWNQRTGRTRTVYVFWRHWEHPETWQGVQWAHFGGEQFIASRRRPQP
jgi:hypothetical protein